jgi:DNA repair protein RecO
MSYRIYTSDAFIITAKQSKDADLSIFVFTELFGLLHATAKSARQMKSKLRYSLQSMTFGSLSMVKGREIWRVTSAKKMISLYDKRIPAEARVLLARILAHVERFSPREQPEPVIFETLKAISGFIFKNLDGNSAINCARLEKIFLLRLLYELGYIEKNPRTENFIQEKINPSFMNILELMTDEEEKEVDKAIDRAMIQSHL